MHYHQYKRTINFDRNPRNADCNFLGKDNSVKSARALLAFKICVYFWGTSSILGGRATIFQCHKQQRH